MHAHTICCYRYMYIIDQTQDMYSYGWHTLPVGVTTYSWLRGEHQSSNNTMGYSVSMSGKYIRIYMYVTDIQTPVFIARHPHLCALIANDNYNITLLLKQCLSLKTQLGLQLILYCLWVFIHCSVMFQTNTLKGIM